MNIRKSKKNNGITLIALVITIIVMLILVAVTITTAINGGLFEKAGQAVGATQNAINQEQQFIDDIMEEYFGNSSGGNGGGTGDTLPTYENASKDEATGILKENATYTSGEYTAVVPKGFKIVEGLNGSTSIADGLVIQDRSGNEYVWIPVTYTATNSDDDDNGYDDGFDAVFYRSDWSFNARGTAKYTDTSGSSFNEPYANGYTGEDTEYYQMVKSVYDNGGFYIGRYEAGSQDEEGNPIARTRTANGTSKVVVKRDQYPYIFVGWGPSVSNYIDDVSDEYGYYQGKGALYLCKHMYDGENIGATSTLCYSIQWDAMLDFIKDSTRNVTWSKDWGNYIDNPWKITRTTAKYNTVYSYSNNVGDWEPIPAEGKEKTSNSGILLTTGANDEFAAKNIYDVAGNVAEWTNEAIQTNHRVRRGGACLSKGNDYGATDRASGTVYICDRAGFRPALYLP